jgi:tRNA (guanine37-N1)-methyltransferase
MRIDVVTIFPGFFTSPLESGLVGKAIQEGAAHVGFVDPRNFTTDRHRSVDDAPYGGGAGMVMKVEPLALAIEEAKKRSQAAHVVLLTPQGRRLEQSDLSRFARLDHLILVAGRYEGFDERVSSLADEELSIGDFVLTGGEHAALVIVDGVVRLLPGTLGNERSPQLDSFSEGLLEHAQYTRPPSFRGLEVPEILREGDHQKVETLRKRDALFRTRARRPDLIAERGFSPVDRATLFDSPSSAPPIAIVHLAEDVSRLALVSIARLGAAYDVARQWIVGDASDRLAAIEPPEMRPSSRKLSQRERKLALAEDDLRRAEWRAAISRLACVSSASEAISKAREELGTILVASASSEGSDQAIGPRALVRKLLRERKALVLVLGSGQDIAADVALPAIRVSRRTNDLDRVAALAVWLDRLRGEG